MDTRDEEQTMDFGFNSIFCTSYKDTVVAPITSHVGMD